MYCHKTKTGEKILLKDLTDKHLLSIIALLERRAKKGITIRYGGSGSSAEDMWYDEEIVKGPRALFIMHYHHYYTEKQKRNL